MLHMKQWWQTLATVSDDYFNLINQGYKLHISRSRGERLKIKRQETAVILITILKFCSLATDVDYVPYRYLGKKTRP